MQMNNAMQSDWAAILVMHDKLATVHESVWIFPGSFYIALFICIC